MTTEKETQKEKENGNKNTQFKKMNSPLKWPGGKRILANRIVERFPEHTCYASVFAGGLWDLFKKPPSVVEVVNDIDGELINFYQVIKKKPNQFLKEIQWDLVSRKLFLQYKADLENPGKLTEVERAKRFYYLLKTSFSGKRKYYGYGRTEKPNLNLIYIKKIIREAHDRLKRVNIECLDWRVFIPKYDSPETLFYLDPPYRCAISKKVYFKFFTDIDYLELKTCLEGVKGMFLLSLNNDEFIRELFKDFTIEEVETMYTLSGSPQKAGELLIRNY